MTSWCGSTLRSRRRSMRRLPNRCKRSPTEPRRPAALLSAPASPNVSSPSAKRSARVFALLNMAGSDSQIVTWEAKYRHGLLRPVTAIREASTLGNPAIRQDAKWEPLIETPGHPDYPSGHCALTGAAVAVLQHFF